MKPTFEDITPLEDETAPLTNMFASILIAVHGGQENVSDELAAALHLMRSIELSAQQLDNLAQRLIDGDPALTQVKHRVLAPINALGQGMGAALDGETLEEVLANLPPSLIAFGEQGPHRDSHLSDPNPN